MSVPDYLYINYYPEKPKVLRFTEVEFDSWAEALFEYMLPILPNIDPEFADYFEGVYYCNSLSLIELSQKYFLSIYHLIMQAYDELERLKPYKSALREAL